MKLVHPCPAHPAHRAPLVRGRPSLRCLPSGALVDPYGRAHTDLRVSVTDRCNLRCVYCMPEEGVPFRPRDEILSFEEITRVARVAPFVGCELAPADWWRAAHAPWPGRTGGPAGDGRL